MSDSQSSIEYDDTEELLGDMERLLLDENGTADAFIATDGDESAIGVHKQLACTRSVYLSVALSASWFRSRICFKSLHEEAVRLTLAFIYTGRVDVKRLSRIPLEVAAEADFVDLLGLEHVALSYVRRAVDAESFSTVLRTAVELVDGSVPFNVVDVLADVLVDLAGVGKLSESIVRVSADDSKQLVGVMWRLLAHHVGRGFLWEFQPAYASAMVSLAQWTTRVEKVDDSLGSWKDCPQTATTISRRGVILGLGAGLTAFENELPIDGCSQIADIRRLPRYFADQATDVSIMQAVHSVSVGFFFTDVEPLGFFNAEDILDKYRTFAIPGLSVRSHSNDKAEVIKNISSIALPNDSDGCRIVFDRRTRIPPTHVLQFWDGHVVPGTDAIETVFDVDFGQVEVTSNSFEVSTRRFWYSYSRQLDRYAYPSHRACDGCGYRFTVEPLFRKRIARGEYP